MEPEKLPTYSIQIREAQIQDSPDIANMWYQSYILHHSLDPEYYRNPNKDLEAYIIKSLDEIFTKHEKKVYIATDSDNAVGFLISSEEENAGIIEEVYIAELFRGQGIGYKLMTEAENNFRKSGRTVSLLQYVENNANAAKFYESMGYKLDQAILYKTLPKGTPVAVVSETTADEIEKLRGNAAEPLISEKLTEKNAKVFVTLDEQQEPSGYILCYQGEQEYDCIITSYGVIETLSGTDDEKRLLLINAEKYFTGLGFTHAKFKIPHEELKIEEYGKLGYIKRQIVVVKDIGTKK